MKKIGLLVVLLAVAGFAWYRYFTTTPKYSLLQAYAAVEAHDTGAFDKYVDVESVAGHLLEEVGKQRSLLSLVNPGSWVVKGLSAALKPALAAGAKKQVDTFVKTGSIAEARKAGGGKFSLAALMGKIVSDSSEFKGVAYETTMPNGTAEVGLEFTQPRYDTTLVVRVVMADKGDYWQVKQIANSGEILQHVSRLEKQRLLGKLTR
jgi:hypothetical protein